MANPRIDHPNRDKAASKATKAIVVLLLLASAGLIALITAAGWSELQGAQPVALLYILLYIVMAVFAARWNRGVLPVAAALAILFAVIAAVSVQSWFDRDKAGLQDPEFIFLNEVVLEPSMLGLLTLILVPVQLLLVAFAMRAFAQKWNVEVEVGGDDDRYGPPPAHPGGGPSPAGA